MLGDTLTITVDGAAKVLSKINQDGYSGEYYLKEALQDFRLVVRHSKDRVSAGLKARDRHKVTFTRTVFPVAPATTPTIDIADVTIVNNYDADSATVAKLAVGLEAYLTLANLTKIVGWES